MERARVQWRLPTPLQLHVLSLLPPNERALSGRLVCPDARDTLTGAQHCTASLSQPLPPHALPWAVAAGQQHVRQLPFLHKLQLLCTAAASGSEVNMEAAWTLLQPSIFPELLQSHDPKWVERWDICDPGVAAVKAGHPQLLGWLLQHCPGLLRPEKVLAAAAKHCTLAGLQATWEALQQGVRSLTGTNGTGSSSSSSSSSRRPAMSDFLLCSAATSATPDAVAKMEWLLAAGAGTCQLDESTLLAAARSGDLDRLRWLHDRGCRLSEHCGRYMATQRYSTLYYVLKSNDLAVVRWLVDEAVCALPEEGQVSGDMGWDRLLRGAARSSDGVAKLQWLRERGAPAHTAQRACDLATTAALAGRAEVVRYVTSLHQPGAAHQQGDIGSAAAGLVGSDGELIAACLRQAGITLSPSCYETAAADGDMTAISWLAREAGVSAAGVHAYDVLRPWPKDTSAHSRGLLEAMQLLVGAGCCLAELDNFVYYIAATRGDLGLVQYLQQQRPGWRPDGDLVVAAATAGGEALLEWLVEQLGNLTGTAVHASPYIVAAKRGDRGTLAALRRLGVPWERDNLVLVAYGTGCPLPAVRWLAEQGAPVGSKVMVAALLPNGDTDTAVWLRSFVAAANGAATDDT